MAVNWCQGEVVKNQVWTDGLFTLHVAVSGVEPFEPGQFLQLGLEIDGKHVNRPYSVASPHGDVLEFYIVRVDDGELTPHLCQLQPGEAINVSQKGRGSFTLKKTPIAETLWLIGTGTGLAPYIAMLRTDEPWRHYSRIVLLHGTRYESDLSYAEEIAQMQRDRPEQLVYLPALTREKIDGTLHGRIPALLTDGTLENNAGCQMCADNSAVMLCGNPAMLDDVEAILKERGMKKHRTKSPGHYVLERYW